MDVVEIEVEVEVEVEVVGRGSWGVNRNLGGSTVKAMMTPSAIREVDRAQAVSGLVPRCWLLGPSSVRKFATAAQRPPVLVPFRLRTVVRCCSVRIRRNDRDHLGRESVWMRSQVGLKRSVWTIC